jgi:parvulin-like peptidyl-prolyl isomerase
VIFLRKLLAGALGFVLVLSACSGADEEVLRVDETVFLLSDVQALYDTGTVEIDDGFREVLRLLIVNEAFAKALEDDFGLVATDEDVEDSYQTAIATMELGEMTAGEYAELLGYSGMSNVGDGFIRLMSELDALNSLMPDAVTALLLEPESVDEVFADPTLTTNVCVRHILVETEEEAEDVLDRLNEGEDFAVVSEEVSLDTGVAASGGDLGCWFASGFVEEFAQATLDAEIDEVYGPVETAYGFHVLVVYERSQATEEEYLADPIELVDSSYSNQVFLGWANEVFSSADIEVAERFGTWNGTQVVASES